jgi:TolB-like protein
MRSPFLPQGWRAILVACALAGGPGTAAHAGILDPPASVGVLLFGNYTGTSRAVEAVMPRIYEELDARGVGYVSHSDLRPVLRKHRIRAGTGIGTEDARAIRQETETSHLLLGSFDIFQSEGNPEIGVSARILEIESMRIVAGHSEAATGEDFAGLFGIGRVTSVDELARRVVTELFEELERSMAEEAGGDVGARSSRSLAVVTFDNVSDTMHAGDAVSTMLISELLHEGFAVVEPGMVNALFLKHRRVWRGGIDYPNLAQLTEAFGVDFVVTGDVETFRTARNTTDAIGPSLSIGARVLSAPDGRLLMSFDDYRTGGDSEKLFQIGRYHSLGRLVRHTVQELVRKIEKSTRPDTSRNPTPSRQGSG